MAISIIEPIKNFWAKLDNWITKPIPPKVHTRIIVILFMLFMAIGLFNWNKNWKTVKKIQLAVVGSIPGCFFLMLDFNDCISRIKEWRCLRLKGPLIETVNAIGGGFVAFGLSKVFHDAETMMNFIFAGLFFLMTLSIWDLLRPGIDLGFVSGLCSFVFIKSEILATRYERIPVGIVAVSLLYVRFRRAEAGKGDQNAEQSDARTGNEHLDIEEGNMDAGRAEARKGNQNAEQSEAVTGNDHLDLDRGNLDVGRAEAGKGDQNAEQSEAGTRHDHLNLEKGNLDIEKAESGKRGWKC